MSVMEAEDIVQVGLLTSSTYKLLGPADARLANGISMFYMLSMAHKTFQSMR